MLSVVSIALERAIHPAAWPFGENGLFIPQVFWYNSAIGPGRRWFAVSTNCPLPGETLNGNPRFRCCWVAVEFVTPLVLLLRVFKANIERETYALGLYSIGDKSPTGAHYTIRRGYVQRFFVRPAGLFLKGFTPTPRSTVWRRETRPAVTAGHFFTNP